VLQRAAVYCSVYSAGNAQSVAVCCSVLQSVAVYSKAYRVGNA